MKNCRSKISNLARTGNLKVDVASQKSKGAHLICKGNKRAVHGQFPKSKNLAQVPNQKVVASHKSNVCAQFPEVRKKSVKDEKKIPANFKNHLCRLSQHGYQRIIGKMKNKRKIFVSTEESSGNDSELVRDCVLEISPIQSGICAQDFEFLRIIGQGAFGKVMLVKKKNGKHANEFFAMKVLDKTFLVKKGQIEHTNIEFQIFASIKHPFICRLRFAFQDRNKLYLVTDYYCGGSLFFHLREELYFTEERTCFYMAEIFLAIEHLHHHDIIYRDLKLENVIMDGEGHIAITDFGLSKRCESASTFCGTAEYMAPELLEGQAYGFSVDWWSFGILLYEMLVGETPFFEKNRELMFLKIKQANPIFPEFCSVAACSIISNLLVVNPLERLGCGRTSSDSIKQHSFFSAVSFEDVYNRQIIPPFQPETEQNGSDFVPQALLNMKIDDYAHASRPKSKHPVYQDEFKDFQYNGTPVSSYSEKNRTFEF